MQRSLTLDSLRGYAIITMVLSGSIAFGDTLPAWMYHAQVPPPLHKFIPTLPGISWVDLVFPFFLFTMGAAIPLAFQQNKAAKFSLGQVALQAFKRYVLLAFFALFTHHLMPWVLSSNPTIVHFLLSIFAFVLVFFQLYQYKKIKYAILFKILKVASFAIAVALLYFLPFKNNTGFSFMASDIIIMVLANMAFFGTIIWWVTRHNPMLRLGILPFIMGIFLSAKAGQGWASTLFNVESIAGFKINGLYQFYFLKYLFIVIPGTLAGEYFIQASLSNTKTFTVPVAKEAPQKIWLIGSLAFAIVASNTILLFGRFLLLNLAVTIILLVAIYVLQKKYVSHQRTLLFQFFNAGCYLLLLGLCFEAYEAGIKKDSSTYSYYFVTSGLAFFMLIGFSTLQYSKMGNVVLNYISLIGKNPMVAYIAGNLLVQPLLHITTANLLMDALNANAYLGFLKGIIFTSIVSLITIFFTKRGWFWKT